MKLTVILFFCTSIQKSISTEWDYGRKNGPDHWNHEYPKCAGKLQSPINILTNTAIPDESLKPIIFSAYDRYLYWNISNNGHTIVSNQILTTYGNTAPSISGSNFAEPFYLTQFHFHWGFNDYQGSEHTFDQIKYPLEVHLVHRSLSNATSVLSYLFELSEKNNSNLDPLINIIKQDADVNHSVFKGLYLNQIFFSDHSDSLGANWNVYYRYIGSLTAPPCTEGVIWTIFKSKIPISDAQ